LQGRRLRAGLLRVPGFPLFRVKIILDAGTTGTPREEYCFLRTGVTMDKRGA
jgi:hypothetical protein